MYKVFYYSLKLFRLKMSIHFMRKSEKEFSLTIYHSIELKYFENFQIYIKIISHGLKVFSMFIFIFYTQTVLYNNYNG